MTLSTQQRNQCWGHARHDPMYDLLCQEYLKRIVCNDCKWSPVPAVETAHAFRNPPVHRCQRTRTVTVMPFQGSLLDDTPWQTATLHEGCHAISAIWARSFADLHHAANDAMELSEQLCLPCH